MQDNEFDIQNANASFFACDIALAEFAHGMRGRWGKDISVLVYLDGQDFHEMVTKDDMLAVAKVTLEGYLHDRRTIRRFLREQKDVSKRMDRLWKRKDITALDREGLEAFFVELIALSRLWWELSGLGEDKGQLFGKECVKALIAEGKEKGHAQEIVGVLTQPESTVFGQMEDAWNAILLEINNDLELKRLVEGQDLKLLGRTRLKREYNAFNRKYFFRNSNFYDRETITFEVFVRDLLKDLRNHSTEDIAGHKEASVQGRQKLEERKHDLEREVTDKRTRILIEGGRQFIEWIEQRKVGMMKYVYYIFSALHQVAQVTGVAFDDISYCTVDEVRALLAGTPLDHTLIERRKSGMFFFYDDAFHVVYGEEGKVLFDLAKKVGVQDMVKGTVASKGKGESIFRGRARVIKDPSTTDFVDGDILVTSMTRIEFVPLMKKAKAIITDEGGIACHAAIVSRELGVPCIIGTKIGTHVLPDGSEVEVDLEAGTVRKLF